MPAASGSPRSKAPSGKRTPVTRPPLARERERAERRRLGRLGGDRERVREHGAAALRADDEPAGREPAGAAALDPDLGLAAAAGRERDALAGERSRGVPGSGCSASASALRGGAAGW